MASTTTTWSVRCFCGCGEIVKCSTTWEATTVTVAACVKQETTWGVASSEWRKSVAMQWEQVS